MQQLQRFIQHIAAHVTRFLLCRIVHAHQQRLDEFEIPVAEHVPDELVERASRIVETVFRDGFRGLGFAGGEFTQNPAIHRARHLGKVDLARRAALVHLGKASRVPEFGREVAVAFDGLFGEADIAPLSGHAAHGEAQRVGAVFVHQFQRVHDVALGLGHLLALLVEDEGVDVHILERNFAHELYAHHHHPGDPEEDDVKRGDERGGGIEGFQFRRLVRPAHRRERPEGGGEPCVEDVFVLFQLHVLASLLLSLFFRISDVDFAVVTKPCRDPVAPPELTRNAPWLDVVHPVVIGLLPVLGHEPGLALFHGRDGWLGHGLGIDIPLVGHPRLDDHVGAVAEGLFDLEVLDFLQQFERLEGLDNFLARIEPVEPAIVCRDARRLRVVAINDVRRGVQDVQRRVSCPLADFEVVEIMRRRDLHGTRALFRVRILVRDDRNAAADDR